MAPHDASATGQYAGRRLVLPSDHGIFDLEALAARISRSFHAHRQPL